jgi:hypothetical protein
MDAQFHDSKILSKAQLHTLGVRRDGPGILRFALHYALFLAAASWLVLNYGRPWWQVMLAMTCFAATTPSLFF